MDSSCKHGMIRMVYHCNTLNFVLYFIYCIKNFILMSCQNFMYIKILKSINIYSFIPKSWYPISYLNFGSKIYIEYCYIVMHFEMVHIHFFSQNSNSCMHHCTVQFFFLICITTILIK